jgi:L-2-hydroxyglutarate oxidase
MVGPERIREREPHAVGVAALEVPSTGIVSADDLVKAYARVAAGQGANILTDARVVRLDPGSDSIAVGIEIGDEREPARLVHKPSKPAAW